jgi:two-component system, NtrC family, nitrogen regulation sensor histidine kinase NtrY
MKRVMINLLDNAIDAIKEEGRWRLASPLIESGGSWRSRWPTTAKASRRSTKRRIFEPYFSTKKHGTGLGLAIVSEIISDHNGSIRVQLREPSGTRFIIELPVKA